MLLTLLIGGCQKEDHTLPATFNLNFTIKDTPILGGSVVIDEIDLGLNSINISGYREEGGDVFLTRNFDKGKIFVIIPLFSNTNEVLDIPQGVYNPLSFSYTFQPDAEEEDLIEDMHEWVKDLEEGEDLEELQDDLGDIIEDYLEDVNPCIMVRGRFTNNGKTKHIIMVVNDPLIFKILGNNKNGGPEVVLDKESVNTGNLQFNPSYWFSVITPEMLNTAFVGVIDNEEYILLNKYINTQVYTSIFNRIEQSTTLTINE
ncbi:MAG: hypothetical protein RBR28_06775 [Lentimicrobium sp.]|jgi:hypothetical protein|nr:hypothetical protein [Lentimicrobium sp.]